MKLLLEALSSHAQQRPHAVALADNKTSIHYSDLSIYVHQIAEKLRFGNMKVLGIYMDNSPAWAVIDLAAQIAGVTLVPLPAFFSDRQLAHAIGRGLLRRGDPQAVRSCPPSSRPS